MQLSIAGILTPEEIEELRTLLSNAAWEDGRATAGWAAALVKHNAQALPEGRIAAALDHVCGKLLASPVFQIAVRPKRVIKAMFSRHRPGDSYGTHVDNALMNGERTDISFTIFLSDPVTYEGGELVIETASGDEHVKLPPGSVFVYPSATLHRVEGIRAGERLAMVGWVRSHVRDATQRELLFDLETARRKLFDREGNSPEFDLVSKACANLMRMWCDD